MLRVIRVGGSLLTWDAFPSRLATWLNELQPATNLLIAGGGPWVELIRQSAAKFQFDDAAAHWLCIQAMDLTAQILATSTGLPTRTRLPHAADQGDHVFCVKEFLCEEMRATDALPETWEVTSDSIAAFIANRTAADQLVLLKSSNATSDDFGKLAEVGFVDHYFPKVVGSNYDVKFVNLRS